MMPSNFISPGPAARLKQQRTDDTPSQEVENEWEEDEELHKFKQGFGHKASSIMDIRDSLGDIMELISVCANALMADEPFLEPIKVHGVLMTHVTNKLKEVEKELARL